MLLQLKSLPFNGFPPELFTDKCGERACVDLFPELHSFVVNEKNSIKQAMLCDDLEDLFHRPLSIQDFQKFGHLPTLIQQIHLTEGKDWWLYSWNSSVSLILSASRCIRQTMSPSALGTSPNYVIFALSSLFQLIIF